MAKPYQDIHMSAVLTGYVQNVTKNLWYPSITNALAQASNNNVINVYSNTFYENPKVVGFTNLIIQAYSFTNVHNNSYTIIHGSVLFSNSSKCKLIGFSIMNSPLHGIRVAGNSFSNFIAYNQIYSNTQAGIFFSGANVKKCTIFSNNFFGLSQTNGIYFVNAKNNIIRNNFLHQNNQGVFLTGTAYSNLIIANQIYSNSTYLTGGGSSGGIVLNGGNVNRNTITSNFIYGTNQKVGIYLNHANNNYIQNNNWIYQNGWYGIWLHNTVLSNFISGNQIYSNIFYGIRTDSSDVKYNTFTGNNIFGQKYGVLLQNSTNNYIKYNNKIYNNNAGIAVGSLSVSNLILANQIYSNNAGAINTGIYFYGTGDNNNIIRSNSIFGQQNNGIYFTNVAQLNSIAGNQIYFNNKAGVFMNGVGSSVNNNIVKSNTIFGPNQKYGIYIQNANNITNCGNNIFNNTNAIALINSTNSVIARNVILSGLLGTGIYYNNSSSLIQQNTITNNLYGLKYNIGGGISQLITKNNIINNTINFTNLSELLMFM